jgi:predicted DNA-binding antitoxin AbrB/MazE fold protein
MSESITAVYRKGVLQPLGPLNLEENSQVEIQILIRPSEKSPGHEARQALIKAGVIRPRIAATTLPMVAEADLITAARDIGAAGSLSDVILSEREGQ